MAADRAAPHRAGKASGTGSNPGAYDGRLDVAAWHARGGRVERAQELYREANEVDPFRRDLHRAWGDVLVSLERWQEAGREYAVVLAVPADLDLNHLRYVGPLDGLPPGTDPDHLPLGLLRSMPPELVEPVPLDADGRAEVMSLRARCLRELGRTDEADALERAAEELQGGR